MTETLILPIDIPTLALSRGMMQMMFGGLLLYIGSRHADGQGARWWAAGFLLNGLSLFVFPIQVPEAWEQPRAIVNHLSLGASSICLLCGFWRFGRQPFLPWLLGLLVVIPLTSIIVFELLWPIARWRVLLTASSQAIFLAAVQFSLGRPRRPELAVIARRMRAVVVVFLLVHIWSYGSLADVLPMTARLEVDYHRSIYSVASLLFMLSLAVGCLALQFALLAARNADLARVDWLTGLLNRRGFFHAAARGPKGRPQTPGGSLIAIDIDHFKQINDRHGHAAGDCVLQQLAELLRAHARPGQLLARLGGEEFCLLDPVQDVEAACRQAEALRAACVQSSADGQTPAYTLSVGVHAWQAGQSLERSLALADDALYAAKRAGRNRVVRSDDLRDGGGDGVGGVEQAPDAR
ncbi:MAG: GGDEF domain-containing protein [Xanthomonadales bacterium]|nr:GGDEF domain-containing protein [Xanthomonadales bacterium]